MGLFGIFNKKKKETLDKGLERTQQSFFSKISKAVAGKSKVDDEVLVDTRSLKPSRLQAIHPGDFVDVVVTDALENDLMAELV